MVSGSEGPPAPSAAWAYFFDVDGTLADLAPTPAEVRVEAGTIARLLRLYRASEGAVALVSGRSIADVDSIFHLPTLPVAGQHGLERRDALGTVRQFEPDGQALDRARDTLSAVVKRHPELLLEDKGLTLALHYRGAPLLASFAHRTMTALCVALGSGFTVQRGKRVVELKPAGTDKGSAVLAFMRENPFRRRTAVYVGDDATDEHAFAVVNGLGGYSVKVGIGATTARWRLGSVAAVQTWMEQGEAA
ncbi:MAG: trehalose-phosphatase [Gemmatimonadaceae bacterium]